jgi:hypothetical protein
MLMLSKRITYLSEDIAKIRKSFKIWWFVDSVDDIEVALLQSARSIHAF